MGNSTNHIDVFLNFTADGYTNDHHANETTNQNSNILSHTAFTALLVSAGVATNASLAKPFGELNQVPLLSGALHFAESGILTLGIFSGSAGLAGLAGLIGWVRGLAGAGTLLVSLAFGGLFVKEWCMSIGRDGRQRIEKKTE
ncbi:hypothetical protein HDV05_001890 [Chytridiales sp. JEL 0842]|nr:hypothetical protein HDV05_001890 [Chytridiales sp. JEL 0842]